MTAGTTFLLIFWIGSHLAILLTIKNSKFRSLIFAIIGFLLLVAYTTKPYTYDLQGYSIFFNSGFIETFGWHFPDNKFQLDRRDTTGEPFAQAYEPGFRLLAKAGNLLLPTGSLVPRFDPDMGDLKERMPSRSDAMILLIMFCGFVPLYIGGKQFFHSEANCQNSKYPQLITVGPLILGSIFFLLGSQNALRQFLGVSIILLALSMFVSRRYFACLILVLLSTAFHKWSPIFGMIGVTVILLGRLSIGDHPMMGNLHIPIVWEKNLFTLVKRGVIGRIFFQFSKIGRIAPLPFKDIFHLSLGEVASLMFGIMTIALIKAIAILGIFNANIPLIGDLQSYLIMDQQYESMERLNSLVKASAVFLLFVCSEMILGRMSNSGSIDIRSIRRLIFFFVIPLAVYPEIFSRMLILYWAFEVVFLIWGISSKETRPRLAASVVFISYGFAPNAMNVLIGPNWLYNL